MKDELKMTEEATAYIAGLIIGAFIGFAIGYFIRGSDKEHEK